MGRRYHAADNGHKSRASGSSFGRALPTVVLGLRWRRARRGGGVVSCQRAGDRWAVELRLDESVGDGSRLHTVVLGQRFATEAERARHDRVSQLSWRRRASCHPVRGAASHRPSCRRARAVAGPHRPIRHPGGRPATQAPLRELRAPTNPRIIGRELRSPTADPRAVGSEARMRADRAGEHADQERDERDSHGVRDDTARRCGSTRASDRPSGDSQSLRARNHAETWAFFGAVRELSVRPHRLSRCEIESGCPCFVRVLDRTRHDTA